METTRRQLYAAVKFNFGFLPTVVETCIPKGGRGSVFVLCDHRPVTA